MYKGGVATIEDLSNEQIEDILDLAQDIQEDPGAYYGLASRRIMASLFLEPSTRTRGSFEAAMKRLGGDTITTADPTSSSISKGESLADTIRIWSGYADLIVLRHPWEGAARLAAEYSDVPVINAGDGGHEHPTQTLLDLYTLRREFGTIEGLTILLCGDLKNGRTVHSLIYALSRFGAEIIFLSGEGLDLPDHVKRKVETVYGRAFERMEPGYLKALYGNDTSQAAKGAPIHAIYMTPSQPHMRALYEDESQLRIRIKSGRPVAIYQTRHQVERDVHQASGEQDNKAYPSVTRRRLSDRRFRRTIVLHPLPRVNELSPDMDQDSRSKYFEQARNGVPVRMALVALLFGLKPWKRGQMGDGAVSNTGRTVFRPRSISCMNQRCVSHWEPQSTNGEFIFFERPAPRFVCAYCEWETLPAFFRYPEGEVYRPIEEHPAALDPEAFAFFMDEAAALASGLSLREKRLLNYRRPVNG